MNKVKQKITCLPVSKLIAYGKKMKFLLLLIIGYLFYLAARLAIMLYRSFRAQSNINDRFRENQQQGHGRREKDISNVARIIEEKPLDKEE